MGWFALVTLAWLPPQQRVTGTGQPKTSNATRLLARLAGWHQRSWNKQSRDALRAVLCSSGLRAVSLGALCMQHCQSCVASTPIWLPLCAITED